MGFEFDNLRSFIGLLALVAIAWALSENRKRFPVRLALVAVALQFTIALLFFGLGGAQGGGVLDAVVSSLQEATKAGTSFAFGYVGGAAPPFDVTKPENGFSFAFQALPLVIVLAAISAVLWHWKVLQWVSNGFAFLFEKTLKLGGAVSMASAAAIFMGMVESAVVVGPYLRKMSRAELFNVMTVGLATVAGSVMLLYVAILGDTLPNAATHLIAASIMASPAGILMARILIPAPDGEAPTGREGNTPPRVYRSAIDAFATGVDEGIKLLIGITAMVLAAVATVALLNIILKAFPDFLGSPLSIERILGWVFAPAVWLIGVPWAEAMAAGMVMGTKTALNEVLGFIALANTPPEAISERTRMMMTYAVCGFANFSSMGILLAGVGAIVPDRRQEIIALLFKALFAATLANLSVGAVVGTLPMGLFQ